MTSGALAEIDLASFDWTDWAENPYPLYRRLRDEMPVYHDAPNDTYVVTRYADVYGILTDPKRFSNIPRAILDGTQRPTSQIRMEDQPRHTFVRGLVTPMFTPKEMRRLAPYLQGLARELVDATEESEVVDITSAFAIPLPCRVALDLIGLPPEDQPRFKELTDERMRIIMTRGNRPPTPESEGRYEEMRESLWEIVRPVITARRADPQHDAITRVVQAQDSLGKKEIPDDLLLNILLELMTAGFETTQHLIELLLDYLADEPELWERLRAERELVPVAIEEMLRWWSPMQALQRRAAEDVELHGVAIPRHASVTTVYGSANRDERAYDDPDTFRLDRDLNRHVGFSAGIHYCAGAPVTRHEVKALLDELLDRYPRIERAGPSERWPNLMVGRVGCIPGWRTVPVRLHR
jgi:cytochrome P450 family 109